MWLFVLCAMIFLHIVADFQLQGFLRDMKQKQWWEDNYYEYMGPRGLCRYDYISALISHAYMWTFMVMLPIALYYRLQVGYYEFFEAMAINTALHAIIDHLKANCKKINLTVDQVLHICQILATWMVLIPIE